MSPNLLRILLVEDDPQDAFLLRKTLAEAGSEPFELVWVERLSEGVQQLEEEGFDAILLDLSLPDSRGLVTVETLRATAPEIPIVVLTGSDDKDLAFQAVQQGAQDYLVKEKLAGDLLATAIGYAIERNRLIRKQEQQMQEMRASETRFHHLVETHVDGVLVVDRNGVVRFVNPVAEALLGHPQDELLGKLFGFPVVGSESTELHLPRRDGGSTVVEMRVVGTEWEGEPVFLASLRDITARQRAEEQIRASLGEKETLLKEIHHRVKNNLQLITSLLSMQARRIEDAKALDVLADSQSRVHSMALVHERLYNSDSLAEIDFETYVRMLVNDLLPSYSQHPEAIRVDLNIKEISLDLDLAVPCGLIVNELVTNALKHAFPNRREGGIRVDFTRSDGVFVLAVRDDGMGLPEEVDLNRTPSLGLRLVRILTEQLEGEIEFHSGRQGTEVAITFPAQIQEE